MRKNYGGMVLLRGLLPYGVCILLLGGCANPRLLVKELPAPMPPQQLNILVDTARNIDVCKTLSTSGGLKREVCLSRGSESYRQVLGPIDAVADKMTLFMKANSIAGEVIYADRTGNAPPFTAIQNPYFLWVRLKSYGGYWEKLPTGFTLSPEVTFELVYRPTGAIVWRQVQWLGSGASPERSKALCTYAWDIFLRLKWDELFQYQYDPAFRCRD